NRRYKTVSDASDALRKRVESEMIRRTGSQTRFRREITRNPSPSLFMDQGLQGALSDAAFCGNLWMREVLSRSENSNLITLENPACQEPASMPSPAKRKWLLA